MNHLAAQRLAAMSARIRNKHIRVLCALLKQTSEFDRAVVEALTRCTPAAREEILRCCERATDAFADEFATYLLANDSNPFFKLPPPPTTTDTDA